MEIKISTDHILFFLSLSNRSPALFQLLDETNAFSGINLSYTPAKNYVTDPFPTNELDPTTGLTVTRDFNIYLECDMTVPTVVIDSYTEPCMFYV